MKVSEEAKVLFVDDEANILNALKRELREEAYSKLFAENGEEALKVMASDDIAVIVTDLNMPKMNGVELLYSVKKLYPDTIRLILTSYSEISIVLDAIHTGETHRYITKPWKSIEEFKIIIRQSIQQNREVIEKREKELEIKNLNETLTKQKQQIDFLLNKTDKDKEELTRNYAIDINKSRKFLQNFLRYSSGLKENEIHPDLEKLSDEAESLKEILDESVVITSLETNPQFQD